MVVEKLKKWEISQPNFASSSLIVENVTKMFINQTQHPFRINCLWDEMACRCDIIRSRSKRRSTQTTTILSAFLNFIFCRKKRSSPTMGNVVGKCVDCQRKSTNRREGFKTLFTILDNDKYGYTAEEKERRRNTQIPIYYKYRYRDRNYRPVSRYKQLFRIIRCF